jgi:dihydrofolate synthase/folylpolyglutamate synthase
MGKYEDTIAWLSGLEVSSGWDLKLERMQAALARRRHPEAAFPAIHIAGTNGKGSTAAMIDAILTAAGHRTGLYTSPHLVDFCERIRIGGRTIPEATVVALVAELRADLEVAGITLTHFEFVTLLAFEWFARVGIDVGVIEVGLGGRLDATNVIRPFVTAITSIAMDHEAFLGNDLASIAGEKAGILKPRVPSVVGLLPEEAETVVRERAARLGVRLFHAGVDGRLGTDEGGLRFVGPGFTWDGLRLGLDGDFQRENAEVALTTLALVARRFALSVAAVRDGLARVRWPGRLEVVSRRPLVVLDGAHNPAGIARLARALPEVTGDRPLLLVFAVMADKSWETMLEPLLPRVTRVLATRVGRRGADPALLAATLGPRVPVETIADPRAAVRAALAGAAPNEAVLVTGSLFLVGEAHAELGEKNGRRRLFQPFNAQGPDGTDTPE